MKRLHIAMVVDNELVADVRVLNQAHFLVDKGHKVSILCFDHGKLDFKEYSHLDGLHVHVFKKPSWWKNKFRPLMTWLPVYTKGWQQRINQFVLDVSPDVLHVHDLYMAMSIDRKIVRCPVVLDLHELYPEVIFDYAWATKLPNRWIVCPSMWRKLEAECIDKVDGLIVLSDHFKDMMTEKYPDKLRWTVIYPNVPNIDLLDDNSKVIPPKELNYLNEKFVLFYFGQSAIRRGAFTLLDALAQFDTLSNVHLLLIGPIEKGDQNLVLKRMNSVDLKGKITWIPWIPLNELRNYLPYVSVCLSPRMALPQYDCGVPNKVFQYMYFSKPLIVSDSIAQKELIEASNAGWVYSNGDSSSLKDAIKFAAENPDECEIKGVNGKRVIIDKYNTLKLGGSLLQLYSSLTRDSNSLNN